MTNKKENARVDRLELLAILKPRDSADMAWEEDLTDEASDRLIEAIEAAGFEVVEFRYRSAGA